ncbi:dihydrolipoamide acetyltransferase family protein [Aureimonas sp. N4]|uniref:dihydrolipoamide acetyltransferase family protein n=1 Tax=Aureimonas sp. N4 TaxID=1638165 RepID=UPI000785E6C9|nr:dihydrolipoamide acetyltransferase family protein [Aureimonas sp. N4]
MTVVTMKLPDVGEGIAEAELVEWHVAVGDTVREDQILASVMTDKATVEIPSTVEGTVRWLGGEIGQPLAIGGDLIGIETEEAAPPPAHCESEGRETAETSLAPAAPLASAEPEARPPSPDVRPPAAGEQKPLAAPAVRARAMSAGIDLRRVPGTGPDGRITHEDLDAFASAPAPSKDDPATDSVRETKLTGLRRRIAERMANASRRIPHITIVEEVDVTALEALREQMNAGRAAERPKLTVLPFLMLALVRAIKDQPALNAHFDDEAELIRAFTAVHIGIATQTEGGLMVPVIRHCERRSIWDAAGELARVAEAARTGTASRDELTGSTITISSLGPLGAIATTPIINHPEVAILGVNRMEIRPRWDGAGFVPRKMMNLSSSFDHRVVDGWDAALFVKRLKTLLETPALIFVEM